MTSLAVFADNAYVAALPACRDLAPATERLALTVELAWHLRQRDTARARLLADEAQALAAATAHSDATVALALARVALVRAEAHWLFAELDEAQSSGEQSLQAFVQAGDAAGASDACWLLAHVAHDRGDRGLRDRRFDDALAHARSAEDAYRADLTTAAQTYWAALDGKRDAVPDWEARIARLLARGDAAIASWVDDCRGFLAFQRGDQGQAALHLMSAHAAAVATGQQWRAITIATNTGVCFSNLNDSDAVLEWLHDALETARQAGWPGRIALCLIQTARELAQLGRPEAARTMLTEAIERLARVPQSRNFAIAQLYLGEVELDLERPQAALDWFTQARERTALVGVDYHLRGQTMRGRAVALAALRRIDEAFAEATEALVVAEQVGDGSSEIEALRVLADIHANAPPSSLERGVPALTYLQRALAIADTLPGYIVQPELLAATARELAQAGDHAQAYRLAMRASDARAGTHQREATNRAIALEVRHRTEQARREAAHQRALADAEAQRVQALERSNETLERLGAIGQEITASRDITAVFRALDNHVHALLDATHFALYRLTADGTALALAFGAESGVALPLMRIAVDDPASLAARCARERREIAIEWQVDDPAPNLIPDTAPSASVLFAPLTVGERMLGVMTVQSPRPHAYGERERRIFRTLCAYGAIAIERHQVEDALRTSEERERQAAAMLRLMCDNVPDMIWAKDLEKRYLFANAAICRELLNAADTDEPLGRTDLHFALRARAQRPDDPEWHTFGELCQDSDAVTLARDAPSQFVEFGNVAGQHMVLDVRKAPFRDERGNVIGTVGSARNVTAQKEIEAELEQHRRNLEALVQQRTAKLLDTEARAQHILQSSADGLYGVDAQGRISFVNDAACAMLGYTAAQMIGRDAHALIHHSRPDGTPYPAGACPAVTAVRGGEAVRVDSEVYWRADGRAVPVMYAVHPTLREGAISGAVISFVDMTKQHAAAQARERALLAAEHLAQARRDFLANMSHEIRTPLNGVLGFAHIGLAHADDPARARTAFQRIVTSGNLLVGIVNDVLDFSAIEAGRLRVERIDMSLAETVERTTALIAERARAKGLALRVAIDPRLPRRLVGDPLRLGQVLLNVLSNAVKFTPGGEVALTVARRDDRIVFRTRDTGIGIDEALLPRLFEPFQQGDSSATRQYGGTGLGLAISKRLLELMQGEIAIETVPGQGTVVEFSVPLIAAPDAEAATAAAPPTATSASRQLAGLTVLLVEDDPVNQVLIEEVLKDAGARVVLAADGHAALDRLAHDGGNAYDIVLMDIQMPGMDGYEATRRMHEIAPGLPIIGQTAHALAEDRERCLREGMVAHVAKPLDFTALTTLICTHKTRRR